MRIKLMELNAQDLFLNLDHPLDGIDLEALTEEQWQLLGRSDVKLKPLDKVKTIASIIRETDCDVIGLCEVGGFESLAVFNEYFLHGAYVPLLEAGNSNRGIESGFLVKRSLGLVPRIVSHRDWELTFHYPHELDPATHKLAAEAASYLDLGNPLKRRLSRDVPALFLEKDGEIRFILLLVHLKSGIDIAGVDPEGRVRHKAEFEALLAIALKLNEETGGEVPIVLAGDFNGQAGRRETAQEFRALYAATDYEDVLELAAVPIYERMTQFTFLKSSVMAQQLDYIFLPRSLRACLKSAAVYRYKFRDDQSEMSLPASFRDRSALPSDHYPVICDIDCSAIPQEDRHGG